MLFQVSRYYVAPNTPYILNKILDRGLARSEDFIAPIREPLPGPGFHEKMQDLEKYIGNYDFKKAQKALAEIADSMDISI